MGRSKSSEVATRILDVFPLDPKRTFTIQEISKESGVSWDSTKRHVDLFKKIDVLRETEIDGKLTYQKIRHYKSETLFSIPISEEQKKTIRQIYATIVSLCNKKSRIMTKTLAQKIAVEVIEKNENFRNIPRGWYLYGEILLLPFEIGKDYGKELSDPKERKLVESVCDDYSSVSDRAYKVRQLQYERKNNLLYLKKDELFLCFSNSDFTNSIHKNKIRELLNKFAVLCERKESNSSMLPIVDDFCSTALSIFRNADNSVIQKAKMPLIESFTAVWQLVATYQFFESLTDFYDKELLNDYLGDKLKDLESLAIESMDDIHEFDAYLRKNDGDNKLKSLMGSAKESAKTKGKSSDVFREFGLDDS